MSELFATLGRWTKDHAINFIIAAMFGAVLGAGSFNGQYSLRESRMTPFEYWIVVVFIYAAILFFAKVGSDNL